MNNLKIGTRIAAGFATVIAIAISLVFFAFAELRGIDRVSTIITGDNMPGIYIIGRIQSLQARKLAVVMEHVLRSDQTEMARLEAEADGITAQLGALMSDYAKTITTQEDRDLFEAVKAARQPFVESVAEVLKESRASRKKEAQAVITAKVMSTFQKFSEATEAEVTYNKVSGDASAKAITSLIATAQEGVLGGLLLAVIAAALIAYFTGRGITVPLTKAIAHLGEVSKGDLSKDAPAEFRARGDEIGTLARTKQTMIVALRKMMKDISGGIEVISSSSAELIQSSSHMTSGSRQASDKAHSVSAAAEEMSSNITTVAAGMEQTTTNLARVASATEEMTSTIGEIAQNSEKARSITDEATRQASRITEQIDQLGVAAREIGKVTETITEISSQTNLLALNATIEAARAGAAGKGFAVVATEIKTLAQQTAAATEDIKVRIAGVQSATAGGITEIAKVSEVILEVSAIVASIAAAIEEQSAATKDIARNISQASLGMTEANTRVSETSQVSREIAKDIVDVDHAAGEMATGSDHVRNSAAQLSDIAGELKLVVARFRA